MEYVEKGALREYLTKMRREAAKPKQLHSLWPQLMLFAKEMTEVGGAPGLLCTYNFTAVVSVHDWQCIHKNLLSGHGVPERPERRAP